MESSIININNAIDMYNQYKRKRDGQTVTLCYDVSKSEFRALKENEATNENAILFMNCYDTALKIIDLYLEQPEISKYKDDCIKKMKDSKDRIVACLWFFDSIDGAYDFEYFEYEQIARIAQRWCKKKQYEYTFTRETYHRSWLTDLRENA